MTTLATGRGRAAWRSVLNASVVILVVLGVLTGLSLLVTVSPWQQARALIAAVDDDDEAAAVAAHPDQTLLGWWMLERATRSRADIVCLPGQHLVLVFRGDDSYLVTTDRRQPLDLGDYASIRREGDRLRVEHTDGAINHIDQATFVELAEVLTDIKRLIQMQTSLGHHDGDSERRQTEAAEMLEDLNRAIEDSAE